MIRLGVIPAVAIGMIVKPAEPCPCGCRQWQLESLHLLVGAGPQDEEQVTTWACARCRKTFDAVFVPQAPDVANTRVTILRGINPHEKE